MYEKDLYLFVTNACPNRCKYCYIKYGHLSMTEEDIDKYIEEYKPLRIIFFGGEPLVRLDLIKYTVKKYWDSGIIFQIVTSTMSNWDEFIEFYKEYRIPELQLSWDGFTDSRIGADGTSIAQRVWDNITKFCNAMSEAGIETRFDIKTVINNNNVKDLVTLHNLYTKLKPYGINGEFVIAHGEDYSDEFYEELKKLLPLTFSIDCMYVDHMNKILAYLEQSDGCSCDIGKYITITPDGKVGNCTALSQYDITLDEQISQNRCTAEECQHCKYKRMWDGGCRYERYVAFGKDWPHKHLECTCKIAEIWYKSTEKWLKTLTRKQKRDLIRKIKDYKRWMYKRYKLKV